jgi:hypothetical protein
MEFFRKLGFVPRDCNTSGIKFLKHKTVPVKHPAFKRDIFALRSVKIHAGNVLSPSA